MNQNYNLEEEKKALLSGDISTKNFVPVRHTYTFTEEEKNFEIKKIYKYAKKHIVEVSRSTSIMNQKITEWFMVNMKKNTIHQLNVIDEKKNENGFLEKVVFSNHYFISFPSLDPDQKGKAEVPKYKEKPLTIEFSLEVRAQIEKMLKKWTI
jgi:hypothetical protein